MKRRIYAFAAMGLLLSSQCLRAQTHSTVDNHALPSGQRVDNYHVISYQGALSGSSGNAVANGTYHLTVRLYADPDGGTPAVWEDESDAAVMNGVFSLSLGSRKPLPAAVSMDRPLWLAIQLGDGPELRPLSPLSASPYALNVPNGAITAQKMGTDYVGSLSINGQKISGKGEDINLLTGEGITAALDPSTNTVVLKSLPSAIQNLKGADGQSNLTVFGTLTVTSSTFLNTTGGTTTVSSLDANKPVKTNGSKVLVSDAINLASSNDVGGTLPLGNGGTGLVASGAAGNYLRSDGSVWTSSPIQVSDVPTLNQNTTGTAANITGTVAIAHGGTGATTATAALTALLPNQTGQSGMVLESDGTIASWQPVSGGGGSVTSVFGRTGDVVATLGDYSFSLLSGSVANTQLPIVDVPHGGTGANTLTGILHGNGTNAVTGAAINLNSSDVTSLLPTSHGGTGNGANIGSHFFFAGPVFGPSGSVGFRQLDWTDMPDLSFNYIDNANWVTGIQNASFNISGAARVGSGFTAGGAINTQLAAGVVHSGGAGTNLSSSAVALGSEVTGTLAVANGGTGATTAASALANLGAQKIWVSVPASSGASGSAGDEAFDSNYLYICVSTNTWIRVAKDSTPW